MKQIISYVYFFLILFSVSFAQKEGNVWYFGEYAGMDFNSGAPVALTNSAMNTFEGCATISDINGNLLFYTDGSIVWDRTHAQMPNGAGLKGNSTSTQSSVVIPYPGSTTRYYIFTVDDTGGPDGVQYSIVDMTMNGGLGDIDPAFKNILLFAPATEKLTAVKHKNGGDIWVIAHGWGNNTFYVYLVTQTGISAPTTYNIGMIHNTIPNQIGYMKSSHDGNKLAVAISFTQTAEIFDFNNATGAITNPITLSGLDDPYGIEFSPDDTKLYFSSRGPYVNQAIYQFDLTAPNIPASKSYVYSTSIISNFGALQLGPDGKIYLSVYASSYLGVINAPDNSASSCNFVLNSFYLGGKKGQMGLPNFITSFFLSDFEFENTCFGDSTTFVISDTIGVDSVLWNFNDPNSSPNDTSTLFEPVHIFSSPGTYNVSLIGYHLGIPDTVYSNVVIHPLPVIIINDTAICDGESITFDAGSGFIDYLWQDASTNQTFTTSLAGTYWVEVTDTNECINRDTVILTLNPNPVININDTSFCQGGSVLFDPGAGYKTYNWQNGSGNQTFSASTNGYYWVEVTDNNDCYDIDSALLIVYPLPYVDLGNKRPLCEEMIVLDAGNPGASYLWQDGSTDRRYTVTVPETYWVAITDTNGCQTSDTIEIVLCSQIWFPNSFTPNGDGINEVFKPGYTAIQRFEMYIYNRWGEMVFETTDINKGWDGTLNGNKCQDGTYYWEAVYDSTEQLNKLTHGFVILLK